MTWQIRLHGFMLGLAVLLVSSGGAFWLSDGARAQSSSSPQHVGVLLVEFLPESNEAHVFRQGLRDAGYTEGRDVVIEWRYAKGDYARLPGLAAELVQHKVDVIVVDSTPGAQAVKRTTSDIPIVIALAGDVVGSGLAANLAHPGGNITGFSTMAAEQSTKRLQILKEAIPRLTKVAVLWNPDTQWHAQEVEHLQAVAPSLSIELSPVSVRAPEEFAAAFTTVRRSHAQALYVLSAALFGIHRKTLLELASKARLPGIYSDKHYPEEGGLMSYGTNYANHWRQSAGYVDKILKGAKPGDLPIQQATTFELVVNLKTAKTLRLVIPRSVLQEADEIIK